MNVYGYEPVYYTERCCAITMQLLDSIFQKSSALAQVHEIFSTFVELFSKVCDALKMAPPHVRLACFLSKVYEKASDFADVINANQGNPQYYSAFNTAKLQYKSMHAMDCLYGLKK